MGSSGESNSNGIDATVGGLVWVRRKNGSWWPGRIMGLDELSESCLVSPRSGTPVKLLGREDASVDWYNLEKSKRVKAFRCGEYDECIEKAKVSAASSNKKAGKYAHRDDAILHALELESAHLDKEQPLNLCSGSDKSGSEHGGSAGELPVMSNSGYDNEDMTNDLSDSEDNSNSAPELSQSGISFEEPNQNGSLKMHSVQGRRRRTLNDSEDDGTEGVKRMRGLEDLGIGVVSKRKIQGTGTNEIVQHVSASLYKSSLGNCLPNRTYVNGGKGYSSTMKRKRSQVANVHEFLKRKNPRQPLTKVLESTAMVSVPVICDQLPGSSSSPLHGIPDGKISGLDSNDSKKSFPMATHNSDSTVVAYENGTSVNVHDHGSDPSQISHKVKENETSGMSSLVGSDSSDKLFDVPFVGVLEDEKHSLGFSHILVTCLSDKLQVSALGQQSCHGGQPEALSLRNEGQHESACTSSAAGNNLIGHREEKDSSKWQSKGKRNLRHTSKNRKQVSRNYADVDRESNAYSAGIENADGFTQGGAGQKVDWGSMGAPNASYNCASQAKCNPVAEVQLDGFRDLSKHIRGKTAEAKLLPDGSLTPHRLLPYRQSRFAVNSIYQMGDIPGRNYCSDDSLYDVKLEVKSSYRPHHVPLVSLDGKAFIGHPLTVEVLDDGHCPRLPMIDLNKDKDLKKQRDTHKRPTDNSCMLEVNFDASVDDEMMEYWFSQPKENMHDQDAVSVWECHIKACTREASSSGLSDEERRTTPTVRGRFGFSCVRNFIHADTLVVPLISPVYEEDLIRWVPDLPAPAPQVSVESFEQIEEIVVEGPDMNATVAQIGTRNEEVAESATGQGTSERHSSQPIALAAYHPHDQPQQSRALSTFQGQGIMHDTVESSRPSLPPNLEDVIGKIVKEQVKEQVKKQVKEQVQESLAPTHALINQMLSLLTSFHQTHNLPAQPSPPPPENQNPPPPSF